MLLDSGKNAITQQSNCIAKWFLLVDDGHWPIFQPTTSNLVVTLDATFLVQNCMSWIELAAGRMIEEATIHKNVEMAVVN